MKIKGYAVFTGIFVITLLYSILLRKEGFKNVSSDAKNQIQKIVTKSLPKNALCIRGSQCISGKCLTNQNETLYGYCDAEQVGPGLPPGGRR